MNIRVIFVAVSLAVILSSPALGNPAALSAAVGVMPDPCSAMPRVPQAVIDYFVAMGRARTRSEPMPASATEGQAAYEEWERQKQLADFPNLCRYEAQNRGLPAPTRDRIVFMGDSITQAWKSARPDFFRGDTINRGISGQTTAQMLGRFQSDVIDLRPATVHILAGTNDIAGNTGPTSLQRIENNIRSMVELAKAHRIKVVLGTVLPSTSFNWRPQINPVPSIQALNTWLRQFARSKRLTLIDYFAALDDGRSGLAQVNSADGVHPTSIGYAEMEVAFARSMGPSHR